VLAIACTYALVCRALLVPTNTRRRRTKLLALASFVVVPILPVAWVQVNTALFGEQFRRVPLEEPNSGVEYLRVFWVTPARAKVFFVLRHRLEKGHWMESYRRGEFRYFERGANGRWGATGEFDTVWSEFGTADGNTFPPFR